jgi:hypothetical protein
MATHIIDQLSPMHIVVGRAPHMTLVDVIFENNDIDTTTVPETVAPSGGLIALRSTAAVLEVVSDSAADDGSPAGTGAQTLRVVGLDASYHIISEDFVLDGTTAVVGSKLFFRINSAQVLTAGTGKTNAGNITIRDQSAGATRSYILAGRSIATVGVWTTPAGHSMIAQGWLISVRDESGVVAQADVEFWATKNGVRSLSWSAIVSGTLTADFSLPHYWDEKTDVEVIVSRVQNNNTRVAFHGHGVMVGPNADL